MKRLSDILMKVLAAVLLIAGVLKGLQLLTEPVANNDIWSYRPFLILKVEFELALAIWFLSVLFKKGAWLAALTCFSVFSAVTLYKGLTGAASCGCFGPVDVNPWITLLAIDLPAVIALSVFRPKGEKFVVWPSIRRFVATGCIALVALGVTTPILALNAPAKTTSSYEVLEPESWVGKKLPILEYIDIAESLERGNWLILLHHHDCPDCTKTILEYEHETHELNDNRGLFKIAFIEVPPYGLTHVRENSFCIIGRLAKTKEWFVTTPLVALSTDGQVQIVWQQKIPSLHNVCEIVKSLNVTLVSYKFERRLWNVD